MFRTVTRVCSWRTLFLVQSLECFPSKTTVNMKNAGMGFVIRVKSWQRFAVGCQCVWEALYCCGPSAHGISNPNWWKAFNGKLTIVRMIMKLYEIRFFFFFVLASSCLLCFWLWNYQLQYTSLWMESWKLCRKLDNIYWISSILFLEISY